MFLVTTITFSEKINNFNIYNASKYPRLDSSFQKLTFSLLNQPKRAVVGQALHSVLFLILKINSVAFVSDHPGQIVNMPGSTV